MHYNNCSGRWHRPCARFPFPLRGLAWRLAAQRGHTTPAHAALELWLAEPSSGNPYWGAPDALERLRPATECSSVKNNNYESLITLCLSSVSLLSITQKGSWNRVISITFSHGSLVLFLKIQDLCVFYLLFCVMSKDYLLFLILWCFCQDCLGWGECCESQLCRLWLFHLIFFSQPTRAAWGPGADGFIVTLLSQAQFAVGSDLKSCSAWILTWVICRETLVSDTRVLGKFGRSCFSLSCLQRWITWGSRGWMPDIPSICI